METEELERSGVSPAATSAAAVLWFVHSPDAALIQTHHPLTAPITIGRAGGDAGLAIADSRISREQATLCWRSDGAGCEVRDLDSRNGTFVDGQRVTSAVAPMGSIVRVGDTLIEVARAPEPGVSHPLLVGRSATLSRLCAELHRVGASEVSVLIEGETGTGKELVARALHELGTRGGRLVAVNCASIPPAIAESFLFGHRKGAFTGASSDVAGVFADAQDGTLFLDEVGELPLALQAKLLRVLETREFSPVGSATTITTNARIVSATNARLRLQIAAGGFRSDLFARLAGVELAVPPLRQRRSDIPLLFEHFLGAAAPGARFTLSANALESLILYPWSMNVRELRAVCGRLALAHPQGGVLRSAEIAAVMASDDAAPAAPPTAARAQETAAPSRAELSDVLRAHGGNVMKLAAHYQKDRKQIYRWLELHGLDARDFR